MFRYLPEQASEVAPRIDWLHNLITDISVFFTVVICGAMLYFAFRYRKRDGVDHETPQIRGSNLLEVIWTVVPTIICCYIAYYGVMIYKDMVAFKKDAVVINAVGRQWAWDFEYENGKKTNNEFAVPVGKPVKLILSSTDVLHSFFIPAMRVKKDAVPGMFTSLSFTPVKTGEYTSFCTEYCGKDHSAMLATLKVLPEAEYERWLNDRTDELLAAAMSPVELGKKLYAEKGCNACHSLDGAKIIGPSFLKLYGQERECESGNTFTADEEYLRDSILNPRHEIVKGYPAQLMPVFEGQLDEREVKGLVAFIRSLDGSAPVVEEVAQEEEVAVVDPSTLSPEERGKWIYENKLCITCHTLDGSRLVGPSFKNAYGRQGKLADGSDYEANDEYITESLRNPGAKVVEGYAPAMPPYGAGQLSDDDIAGLIAWMKTVK